MNSSRRWIVALQFLLVAVCLPFPQLNLHADVIYLNDGNVLLVEKAWIEGNEVKYQTSRGVRSVPKSTVREIQTENLQPAPASAKKWGLESIVDESGTNRLKTPEVSISTGNSSSNDSLVRLRQNLSTNPADSRARSELIQALNSIAWLQLTQGDLPGARTTLEEALSLNRRDSEIASNLALVHLRMGSYRAAEDLLKTALENDRNNPDTHYLLGVTYYAQEKITEAIDQWTAGLRLGPDPEMSRSLEKAQKEARVHDQLGGLQSTHFILRYDQRVSDQRLGQQILTTLEELYSQLSRELTSRPPGTIAVILYPNQTFFDITRAASWTGAMFDGKIRVPTKGLSGVTTELQATLIHEMTHAFIAALPQDCPAWFNEGVAQLQEGESAAGYKKALAQLRQKDQLIPLKSLEESFTSLPDAAVEIAYAEGLSATEFIVARFGKASIRNILELMAQNYNFENAFRTTLKLSVAEFESAWQRDLSQ
jgi:tetratricopeptide (TPR) repeat protein